jgi:hypothetical protein
MAREVEERHSGKRRGAAADVHKAGRRVERSSAAGEFWY